MRITALIFIFTLMCAGRIAHAQYTFTTIAAPGAYRSIGAGTLNNRGEVSFTGFNTVFGNPVNNDSIVRGDGITTTVIATSAQFSNGTFNAPDINCDGEVGFRAVFGGTVPLNGSFKGSGGAITTIATASNGLDGRNIDDDGTVVFTDNFIGVRFGNGGVPTTVQARNSFEAFGTDPDIRNGKIVYDYFMANGDIEIRQYASGTISTIASVQSGLGYLQLPRISYSGDIIYFAQDASFTNYLNVYSGGVTTTRVDSSGPYAQFPGPSELNYYGVIAFTGLRDDFVRGVYTGPDPISDKVIEAGDTLLGRTVQSVTMGGLNDRGQISFAAYFTDGSAGMFRADPPVLTPDPCVPAPSSVGLVAMGLVGSFRRKRGTAR